MPKSNVKGSSFERKISRELSLWLSGGKHDDLLWRTATSGGTATSSKNRLRPNQAGDIGTVSSGGAWFIDSFYIECKHYKDLNIRSLLTLAMSDTLYGFWLDTYEKAESYGKVPVLIAKQNHVPTLFCTTPTGSERLFGFSTNNIHPISIFPRADMLAYLFDEVRNTECVTQF